MPQYFDRYYDFRSNGSMKPVYGITIPQSSEDKTYIYKLGQTRLDKVSNMFYNNPYSGWLIMLANPQYGGLEQNIPDGSVLTIPFPLVASLQDYTTELNNHFFYYGR